MYFNVVVCRFTHPYVDADAEFTMQSLNYFFNEILWKVSCIDYLAENKKYFQMNMNNSL